jgi:serine/threonine protein phosphatase PrpC
MSVVAGANTDVGRVRQGNEDAYLADDPIFAVADGMGGHLAGDVASSTAVEVISESADNVRADDPDSLIALLRKANSSIYQKAQSDPSLHGMGTTCTLLMVDGKHAQLAHVGDSRAYLLRDGELSQLTEDHSLVGRLVREGRLTAQEAENHPQRSIITRALGVDVEVEIDTISLDLQDGDRLLLCSDGLSSMIDSVVIEDTLERAGDPQKAADTLVRLANEAGGEDNITVVVIDVAGGPPPPPPGERRESAEDRPTGAVAAAEARPEETRHETPTAAVETDEDDTSRRRSWPRRLLVAAVVLAIVAAVAYAGARYALDNSFYVGLDDNSEVTIYRGIPDEILGLSLSEVEESTGLEARDLQEFQRDDVRGNKKFTSLEDAQTYIENLERNAESIRGETARKRRDKS